MVWLSKMGKHSSPKISWVSCARNGGGKEGYFLCAILGITSKVLCVFVLKLGRGCTRNDPRPWMDEGSASDIGMPRMNAPYCQVGFLRIGWRGLMLLRRMKAVIDMWQQVLSGAMDWCRVLSSGLSHPPPICKTVLIHRATLITVQAFYVKSCLISKDLKQNAKKKKKWC